MYTVFNLHTLLVTDFFMLVEKSDQAIAHKHAATYEAEHHSCNAVVQHCGKSPQTQGDEENVAQGDAQSEEHP